MFVDKLIADDKLSPWAEPLKNSCRTESPACKAYNAIFPEWHPCYHCQLYRIDNEIFKSNNKNVFCFKDTNH
jgi:hypothetical protein